jgi:hypothetical protein
MGMNKKQILKSSRVILREEQRKLHVLLDSEDDEEKDVIFYKGSMQLLTDALNGLLNQIGDMSSKVCKDHVLTVEELKVAIALINQIHEK